MTKKQLISAKDVGNLRRETGLSLRDAKAVMSYFSSYDEALKWAQKYNPTKSQIEQHFELLSIRDELSDLKSDLQKLKDKIMKTMTITDVASVSYSGPTEVL